MLKSRPAVVTCSLAAVMLMAIMTQTVRADPIADFYRGKQVSVVIGTSASATCPATRSSPIAAAIPAS